MLSEKAAENECADLRKQENSGPIPKNNGGALSHAWDAHEAQKQAAARNQQRFRRQNRNELN
jgi:hypothetical protein